MTRAEEKRWLENGLLEGRTVTRCQRPTKAYRQIERDLVLASGERHAGSLIRGVYRGRNAADTVYAVLLSGKAGRTTFALDLLSRLADLAEPMLYEVMLFRYDGHWCWTALVAAEGDPA